ncbi:MAG: VOC family protein [Paracoccaceae bacterium]|nr:VOC family protein [Paracoccaceae bacterium]
MEKVLGLGGVFFRARDPDGLAAWYRDHLGVDIVPDDYETRPWTQTAGICVFAPFAEDTAYFGSRDNQFMLNFRVRDLDAMVAQLQAAGIVVEPDPESPYPNGRFAWITDPEGHRIELWEPAGSHA